MGTNIEALRAYYKELAKENPDMEFVASQLGIAGDLNTRFDGPEEMPDMTPAVQELQEQSSDHARERITLNWRKDLVFFCGAYPFIASPIVTSQKPIDWENIAATFNSLYETELTDETKISDLRIPRQEDFLTADKSLREAAKRIDSKFKGAYNMRLNYILRGMGLDTTVGQIRRAGDASLLEKRLISAESVQFFRTAFARPTPQEAPTQ